MSADSNQTVALGRVSDEAKPYLLEQHPWLKEIKAEDIAGKDCLEKVAALAQKYGEYHMVRPMHQEDHDKLSPEEDLKRLGFKGEVIAIDLSQVEDEPSPFGDITWKVDEDDE